MHADAQDLVEVRTAAERSIATAGPDQLRIGDDPILTIERAATQVDCLAFEESRAVLRLRDRWQRRLCGYAELRRREDAHVEAITGEGAHSRRAAAAKQESRHADRAGVARALTDLIPLAAIA